MPITEAQTISMGRSFHRFIALIWNVLLNVTVLENGMSRNSEFDLEVFVGKELCWMRTLIKIIRTFWCEFIIFRKMFFKLISVWLACLDIILLTIATIYPHFEKSITSHAFSTSISLFKFLNKKNLPKQNNVNYNNF